MLYSDLREGIYNELCTIPAIWDSSSPPQGKVFREWVADADTEKPFLEFSFMGEIASLNKCALFMQVEVLCFGDPDHALDQLADDVVSLLHHQPVVMPSGAISKLCYTRDSRMDIWSEELKAHGVRLKFWLPSQFYT